MGKVAACLQICQKVTAPGFESFWQWNSLVAQNRSAARYWSYGSFRVLHTYDVERIDGL